ncbi:hypothetical protein [Rhizobium chutanense]|uniref:Uncharacterized protein n=1 Tax=Rhizobium chutanense TaxID=2035448 RepID=A0A432P5G7_9HYPH|nr:hypothetical protein [Rhizobium chutanense]RUM07845.1 hypothetical protein EFR84_06920 [Rhizobium chutanense]
MSSIAPTSSDTDTVSFLRLNADSSSKSDNSVSQGKTTSTAVKKTSPFASDGTTTGLTIFTSTSAQTTSPKFVSLAGTSNGDSSPTAPIQSVIDLLFNSDFMNEINQGFMEGLKDKDKSFESIDVVKNPQNYTAEQKLIMYLDLLQTKATFGKYKDSLGDNQRGIYNDQEILKDLDKSIAILGSDPDVNSLMTEKALKAFKLIFSGYRVAPADTNKDAMEIINDTITRDEKVKELRQKVEDAFEHDIVNGGLLNDGLKSGKDVTTILKEYNAALGFYSMVLPDDFVKSRSAIADKAYAEFFDKNVLPTISDPTTALDGLIRMGLAGDKTERELKGLGSILPVVDSDQLLGRGGSLFGDLKIDLDGLKKVAASEFGSTVPNNITHLFNPTIQAMANQFYGGDSAEVRDTFKADVKALLGPLLDKIGAGEIGIGDLAGNLERLTSRLAAPGGKEVWGYRHAVQTALEGLVMGASLVSKLPANPGWDKSVSPLPSSNLASYSFNDVMAAIMIGTGLAGKGIAATGSSDGRFFIGSGGDAWIAERMFGTKDNGWSKTIQALDLPYIDSEYLTSSLKEMGLSMSGLMKTLMPGTDVIDPIIVDGKTAEEAIKKIIAPSLDALAETLFKGNAEAMAQYKTNFTTIFTALWATMRPGGSVETIKAELGKLIDKTATAAPAGVDPVKYKAALSSGVMSVLTASRSIYAGLNMTSPTWDSIGVVVLHALGALAHMGSALGSAIKASNFSLLDGIGSLVGVSDELARAQRSVLSAFFKNTGTTVGAVAGVAWLPIEYYQFLQGLTSGKGDPVDLIFMGIGTAADTIGAVEGLAGVANMLVNSTFLGRTGATVALVSGGFSLAFAVAGAVSWAAWSGFTIYQSIKQEKAFHKQTDMMNDMLKRTVNDTVGIYAKTGPIIGAKGGVSPAPREPEQRELTPENWDAITADVEKRRGTAVG